MKFMNVIKNFEVLNFFFQIIFTSNEFDLNLDIEEERIHFSIIMLKPKNVFPSYIECITFFLIFILSII